MTEPAPPRIILSFDVEEHDRIEAAAGLEVGPALKAHYRERLGPPTYWVLEELARRQVRATFFIVGRVASSHPDLVRAIHRDGHEVASHSHEHRRLHALAPESFRDDLRRSRDALEQLTGSPVLGFRAPTFSVVRRTAWALDVLAEEGLLYDSSIYPVRHDRYGVPSAPRAPFLAKGASGTILELPPLAWRLPIGNLPAGGGGYFRLFPPGVLEAALRQAGREVRPPVAMLYFHPWEFDPEARRLPLRPLSRWRTYVGVDRSRGRLAALLARHRFARAVDVARDLDADRAMLPKFDPAA